MGRGGSAGRGGGGGALASAVASGQLSKSQLSAIGKLDAAWHDFDTTGSQTTNRAVSISYWERGGMARYYINMGIRSRKPRQGTMGYIDAKTGAVVGQGYSSADIGRAIAAIAKGESNRLPYGLYSR